MSGNRLVEKLRETKDLRNIMFAKRIEKSMGRSISTSETRCYDRKLRNRAYQLFLRLLDPEVRKKLMEIDGNISTLSTTIMSRSGWWRSGKDFILQDNFQNMHDPEFRSFDTYMVVRTPFGYEPSSSTTPYNSYFAGIRSQEEEFVKRNKTELEALHKAYTQKETIMGGSYLLRNDGDYELAQEICRFLGYSRENNIQYSYR